MTLLFDLSDDELPIFLAEVNDQLDTLEKGFLRLEQEHDDVSLQQAVFRAAHTIKGSAGMIGHDRMARLTHVMESVLDSLRKGELTFSADMVDICLDAVDVLRLLRDEVNDGVMRVDDIDPLVEKINLFSHARKPANGTEASADGTLSSINPAPVDEKMETESLEWDGADGKYHIELEIAEDSVASSARAFQVVLALQELGKILDMVPDQETIEAAVPVQDFSLEFQSEHSLDQIQDAVLDVSEIVSLRINGTSILDSKTSSSTSGEVQGSVDEGGRQAPDNLRIGDLLLHEGLITEKQLYQALEFQRTLPPPAPMLGQVLVKLQFITQEALDKVVARQVSGLRQSLKSAKASPVESVKAKSVDQMVRTSVDRLDSLMNLVGEMITSRNRLYRVRNEFEAQSRNSVEVDMLNQTVAQIGRITDQLQEEVMEIRMLPVSNVFNKYPRLIRDLARKAGKKINLEIYGEETELDRSVIDMIRDPLVHLLRNSVDHGIEKPDERVQAGKPEHGTIRLSAEHDSGQIIITLTDDGAGIDIEKLKSKSIERGILTEREAASIPDEDAVELIFRPGLSTAETVSDISGRGVGMDIVRNNVESIGGSIMVDSNAGHGTRFQVILPLTLAIVPTLLVGVQSHTYAIPLSVITETLHIEVESIQTIKEQPVITLRNQVLPVLRLADVLGFGEGESSETHTFVVAIQAGKSRVGLIVDSLLGEEELMVKPIDDLVGRTRGISGAAILGDGKVALIIDVQGLLQMVGKRRFRRTGNHGTQTRE